MPATFESPFSRDQLIRIFRRSFQAGDFAHPLHDLPPASEFLDASDPNVPAVSIDHPLPETILLLAQHPLIRVVAMERNVGFINRPCLNQPAIRMWLFGLLAVLERHYQEAIFILYGPEGWKDSVPEGRLALAQKLLEERHRRKDPCDLFSCLQTGDKVALVLQHPQMAEKMGYSSKRKAKEAVKALEFLRNRLAHNQTLFPDCQEIILGVVPILDRLIEGRGIREALAQIEIQGP